jgi:hypothetical protein
MRHALAVLCYVFATFATQGLSHFVLAIDHYAAVGHMRKDPIIGLGVASMLIQGTIMSLLYARVLKDRSSIGRALAFALTMGTFLVSYIALAEAGKYVVPSVGSWIGVEIAVAIAQFGIFGVLLHLVHSRR